VKGCALQSDPSLRNGNHALVLLDASGRGYEHVRKWPSLLLFVADENVLPDRSAHAEFGIKKRNEMFDRPNLRVPAVSYGKIFLSDSIPRANSMKKLSRSNRSILPASAANAAGGVQ
jgi:hypothetical protein